MSQRAKSDWYLCLPSDWTVCQACSNPQVHPHACAVWCPYVYGGQHPQWDAVHWQDGSDADARQTPARLHLPQTCPTKEGIRTLFVLPLQFHQIVLQVHLFTMIQAFALAALWIIKSTPASLIFPLMVSFRKKEGWQIFMFLSRCWP